MKTFIFLFCTTVFSFNTENVFSQEKVKIDQDQLATIDQVFKIIQNQTDYDFIYPKRLFKNKPKIQLKKGEVLITELLKKSLLNNNMDFELSNGNIVIIKNDAKFNSVNSKENQGIQVSGIVSDMSGVPLPGANIIEKGTSNGTQADFDGKFSLNVTDANAILVVSFLGFVTQEIAVNNQTNVSIILEESTSHLEEVVIIGYGQRTRKTTTGAVGQISGEVLEERPITNVINGLQGAVPGLTINRSSGRPGGEGYSINIRGTNSINDGGNSPLILIDGVEGDINLLNPNDVKSTTVLKDASAAIYGARAAGGVILITTKTGRKNQAPQVTLTTNYSTNVRSNLTERVNLRQWVEMDWEAKTAAGASPQFAGGGTLDEVLAKIDAGAEPDDIGGNAFLFYKLEDWDKALFDDGTQKSHNVTISGGGERSDYLASAGFTRTDGILSNAWDSNERINFRFNHGYNLTDRLRLETKISYDRNRNLEGAATSNNIFALRNRVFTWLPIFSQSGENYVTQWGFGNPRQRANRDQGKRTRISEVLRGNFLLNYKITDGLKIYTQAAINRGVNTGKDFNAISLRWNYNDTSSGSTRSRNSLTQSSSESTYKNFTAYLDYHKQFGNKHDIGLTAGASHEENENSGFWASRQDFSQTEVLSLNLGDTENMENGANASHWAIRSFFGRLTYTFNSKYIAEINYRRDGTSVFSPDKRWGDFGGVSLAWLASEEKFIKNLNIFDHLKIRASQGTTGNQNLSTGNLYDYIALINIGGQYPFGDGEQAQSASEAGIVSQNRTWEDIKTTNIGIDFSFLNSKLSGSFDIFKKENDNMLLGVNLPSVLGGAAPAQNIGSLETKGFELSLNWKDTVSEDFSYSIGVILSDNTNKLIDLDGRDRVSDTREGYPLGTIFGWAWDGIIQNQVELNEYKKLENIPADIAIGDARYKDLNGDGRISTYDDDGNDADIINLGTNTSRYNFGINLAANYKNFDFSTFVQGVGKRSIFYSGSFSIPFQQPWWQPLRRFYQNTWQPENPTAKYPRLTTGGTREWNYRTSENTRVSGAYARFKNITLGYSIPTDVLEKVGISSLRFYLSGEDLFTIDAVDGGYDAENTNGSADFYPYTKRYSLGLTLTF
ncbi:SusC/RagA family TonB-linked outer membrane protein [Flavivirga spongiicola]|uniref:TonB-dependent receptor n=1 Tax=Flavivirga spongiicola TaxID=421621 RepID=A0ABU7XVI6_9FLAO|nr:TonB-dependent receptor [Flavivirga sp. MEBiC05379]MDO5979784.1 TonB-dependent receptor [Flavivirga sp. MEBiC05379]